MDNYLNDSEVFYSFLAIIIIFALVYAIITYIIGALIYYKTCKTNGYDKIAYLSWIPIVNFYVLSTLGSKKTNAEEVKKEAITVTIIIAALTILTFIPFIGTIMAIAAAILGIYYYYRLLFRWSGDQGMSILFTFLTIITSNIFFLIYGLFKMNKPFVAK